MPATRVLSYSGSGIETTFTQGEDACLAALVPELPATNAPGLLIVGALPDAVETSSPAIFRDAGIGPVHFLPPRRAADLPPVGPDTCLLLAQPFLAETARALESRGARRVAAPFPIGAEGTDAWLRAAALAVGADPARMAAAMAPGLARARSELARARPMLEGRSIFFFPDSQLEIPLARFLSRELGMRADRGRHALPAPPASGGRAGLLPAGTVLSEGQDVERQLDRCRAATPDLVVCGLGLANPLEAEGITTKWSIELLFTPDPGLRAGRRSWPSCSPARCAAAWRWRSEHATDPVDLRGPAARRRHADRHRDARRALRAARAAGRHLRRPAVHHDRAPGTRPPVTYTTFQARDLGGDTADLFKTAARDAVERFKPQACCWSAPVLHRRADPGRPGGLARALTCRCRWSRCDLPSYQRKENWGAAETFYQLVRTCAGRCAGRRAAAAAVAATCWARPRWGSATATTCAKSPRCWHARRRR